MHEDELRELRMLAATVYPSLAAHGYSVDKAVEGALEVAEKLLERSVLRAAAKLDVEARANGDTQQGSGGRTLLPQRNNIAGP